MNGQRIAQRPRTNSRLRPGVNRRRLRRLFIVGVYAVSAAYLLFGVDIWLTAAQEGERYVAIAWVVFAISCFTLGCRASRVKKVSALSWSKATQHARQVAGTGAIFLVGAYLVGINQAHWLDGVRGWINGLLSFFSIGALVIAVGASRARQWEVERRLYVLSPTGSYWRGPKSASLPNASTYLVLVGLLALADAVAIWLFSASPTLNSPLLPGREHIHADVEAVFGCVCLLVFAVPVALRTNALRGATSDEFLRFGEYALEFVAANAVFVAAIAAVLLWPARSAAFAPLLPAVTVAIIGTQLIGFVGSSRTDFVALRAEIRDRRRNR